MTIATSDTFVLHKDGIAVEERPKVGRTAVSTRAYSSQDFGLKILRETPALVVQNNYYDYVVQFASCDKSTQAAIFDMYHPPLDDELGKKKLASAQKLYQQIQAMTKSKSAAVIGSTTGPAASLKNYNVEFLHKLLAIFACNAHEYTYRPNSDNDNQNDNNRSATAALFIWGSKIAHSCHPNLAYTSKTHDGALEYQIIRTPIHCGDVLSFSYISKNLYKIPTYKRRYFLQNTKAFFCECERCIGPDYCRVVQCPGAGGKCQKRLACIYHPKTYQPTWACPDCGGNPERNTELQSRENLLEERLTTLNLQEWMTSDDKEVKEGKIHDYFPPTALQTIAKEASQALSPTHHITITALELLATIYSQQARQQKQQQIKLSASLRLLAVTAACQAIAASECVASGCTGCCDPVDSDGDNDDNNNPSSHDALYDRALPMWEAALNLLEVSKPERPKLAMKMVRRYLPVLKGHSSLSSSSYGASLLQSLEKEFGGSRPITMPTRTKEDTKAEETNILPSSKVPVVVTPSDDPNAAKKKSSAVSQRQCCDACGKPPNDSNSNRLLRCSRCQSVWYCNRKCQINHFKAGHKEQCRPITSQEKEENAAGGEGASQ